MALVTCVECAKEVSSEAVACPHCGKKTPSDAAAWKALLFGMFGFGVVILMYMGSTAPKSVDAPLTTPSAQPTAFPTVVDTRQSADEGTVKLANFKWTTEADDSLMYLDATIENTSAAAVKDIEITCTHSAKSGTVIDSNTRTIYDRIKAGGKLPVKHFNMGFIHTQAQRSSCKVSDFKAG